MLTEGLTKIAPKHFMLCDLGPYKPRDHVVRLFCNGAAEKGSQLVIERWRDVKVMLPAHGLQGLLGHLHSTTDD